MSLIVYQIVGICHLLNSIKYVYLFHVLKYGLDLLSHFCQLLFDVDLLQRLEESLSFSFILEDLDLAEVINLISPEEEAGGLAADLINLDVHGFFWFIKGFVDFLFEFVVELVDG